VERVLFKIAEAARFFHEITWQNSKQDTHPASVPHNMVYASLVGSLQFHRMSCIQV
jgi:hypothetical protein